MIHGSCLKLPSDQPQAAASVASESTSQSPRSLLESPLLSYIQFIYYRCALNVIKLQRRNQLEHSYYLYYNIMASYRWSRVCVCKGEIICWFTLNKRARFVLMFASTSVDPKILDPTRLLCSILPDPSSSSICHHLLQSARAMRLLLLNPFCIAFHGHRQKALERGADMRGYVCVREARALVVSIIISSGRRRRCR